MKNLKNILFALTALAFFACAGEKKTEEEHAEHEMAAPAAAAQSKSPASTTMSNIGDVHVHIAYHSPGVRGRTIYGGLVAYDEVWVTGAHSATTIEFHDDVALNGKEVKKGKYALFTIPGKTEWTLIINKNFDQHLADDYEADLDVLRLTLKPETLENVQEHLLYEVKETKDHEGVISISWANTKISFKIEEL